MNTLYILGNGFDIDLGFDTTYSSYVKSVHFQGDPFNDDVKGLKHDSLHDEVKKIATYLESKKDCQLWFDLEILLTKYYDYIFRKIIQSNKKDDLFHIHKYEVFPYIQKTLSEFIYTKVQYTYNNLKLDKESNASKLLKDMVSRISTSDSKIITFNYTGTSILKKELENLLPRKLKKNEIFDKITESIFSVHGDVYSNENFNSNIVLGNSDRYINENKTKQLLDKTFQNAIINGKRSDNFFKKFDSFIIFGHSFGESDSYFFIKLLQNLEGKNFFIYTKKNEEYIIKNKIDQILKENMNNIPKKYEDFTAGVAPKYNDEEYLSKIDSKYFELFN